MYIKLENEEDIIKSKIIFDNILEVKNTKHNYIIVPVAVLNIMESLETFISVSHRENLKDGMFLVGYILKFTVYVDIFMKSDEILLSYDKSIDRDNKLDFILNDVDLVEDKIIKII